MKVMTTHEICMSDDLVGNEKWVLVEELIEMVDKIVNILPNSCSDVRGIHVQRVWDKWYDYKQVLEGSSLGGKRDEV